MVYLSDFFSILNISEIEENEKENQISEIKKFIHLYKNKEYLCSTLELVKHVAKYTFFVKDSNFNKVIYSPPDFC